jgi:hypothetical protein
MYVSEKCNISLHIQHQNNFHLEEKYINEICVLFNVPLLFLQSPVL